MLENFFSELPRSTEAAAHLAKKSDFHLKTAAWTEIDRDRPLRYALEVRHASFVQPAFIELLRRYQIALVVADTAGKWPYFEDITADLVYARLHGDEVLYVSGYSDVALDNWAEKIRRWLNGEDAPNARLAGASPLTERQPRDVFVYFDNDVKTRAPYDAMTLAHKLQLGPKTDSAPPFESIAEEPWTVWPASRARRPDQSSNARTRS